MQYKESVFCACVLTCLLSSVSYAGVFVCAHGGCEPLADERTVVHALGYEGTGQTITLGVCFSNEGELENASRPALERALDTLNQLEDQVGAFDANEEVPENRWDFETAVLHELGHCLGLGHPNHEGTEFTASASGENGVLQLGAGIDQEPGTADDQRGDDESWFWFSTSTNDPYVLTEPVGRDEYSADKNDLEVGLFPAWASLAGSLLEGIGPTQSVMASGHHLGRGVSNRALVADDVATLRLARTGLDGAPGTEDDYTVLLFFTTDSEQCDTPIEFARLEGNSLGVCPFRAVPLADGHYVITQAPVRISKSAPWYFGVGGEEPWVKNSRAKSLFSTSARLNMSVNPLGTASTAFFEWGTSSSLDQATDSIDLGAGTDDTPATIDIHALSCGTTYYARAVAENQWGTSYGETFSFTTLSCGSAPPPTDLFPPTHNDYCLLTRPARAPDGSLYATVGNACTTSDSTRIGVARLAPANGAVSWGPVYPSSCDRRPFGGKAAIGKKGVSVDGSGVVFAVGDDNECTHGPLFRIEGTSGAIQDAYPLCSNSPHPRQTPALDDARGRAYFGSEYLCAARLAESTFARTQSGGREIGGRGLVIDKDGSIYYSSYARNDSGETRALAPNMNLVWEKGFPQGMRAPFVSAVALGRLYLHHKEDENRLHVWEASEGEPITDELWPKENLMRPVIDNVGRVYASGATTPEVVALAPNGTELWRVDLSSEGATWAEVDFLDDRGFLYVRSGSKLFAFRTSTGQPMWSQAYDAGAALTVPATLGSAGHIILGDDLSRVHFLDTNVAYQDSPWPIALHSDPRHTGKEQVFTLPTPEIFADGFESGNTNAW